MSKSTPKPPTDTSNARNEYIPSFIASKPFYAADLIDDSDYLQHQRSKAEQKDTISTAKWYSRSKTGPAATKYRKGACANCGAMTHKTNECLSRPRKVGAKYTGRDIQADEVVEEVKLGFDAKRDRWNGYDEREYDAVVRDYQEMEMLRNRQAKEGEVVDDEDGDDDARIAEETDMGRSQPTSTRQLRLREDTAGYLRNLDLDSARYDPKTRSMDTSAQALNKEIANGDGDLASEGFLPASHQADPESDAAAFERAQRFAWENQQKSMSQPDTPDSGGILDQGVNAKVHLQANPTASLLAHRKHLTEQAEKKKQQEQYLKDRYGEQASSKSKPLPSVTATEAYVEYDPETGRPIDRRTGKVAARQIAKSRYAEDVYPGNHTSVFGSWWRDGSWGYRCCRSFVKNSYCTGEEGRRAFEEEEAQRKGKTLVIEKDNDELDKPATKRELEITEGEESSRAKRAKTEEG